VLKPVASDANGERYEITQQAGKAQILPGLDTEVWGYNGIFPGPTIHARSGRQIVVAQRNALSVPTVTHLHGGRTPVDSDGYPTDLVYPESGWRAASDHPPVGHTASGAKDYTYPLNQRAATLWYHDHRMDFTGPQVFHGLAGFFLIRDDEEASLPLPADERDIPLMICDRSFAADGSFDYPSKDPTLHHPGVTGGYTGPMNGVLGDVVLANGAAWPYLEVANTRYRFRILNASNARRYRLALDPPPPHGPAFVQVGSDGGLLASPVHRQHIDIAEAERFDVVLDFSAYRPGTRVRLVNQFGTGTSAGKVLEFRTTGRAPDHSHIPTRLSTLTPLRREQASTTRDFVFNQGDKGVWVINGNPFDPQRDDATPRLDATEIWRLTTDAHHPIHLHLVHFQVLSRDGKGPGPYDTGWKDTIDLGSGETAEIITTFTGYRGRYVFHCHNLEHEDMAMMANFHVT
jgi:spore coat protein A